MIHTVRRLIVIALLSLLFLEGKSQPAGSDAVKKEAKPYKILTSGRQITIRSTKDISHVMLWTTNGYRVVEQKDINNSSYILNIPLNQKAYFLMIGLSNGKIYTEKIGIQ